VAEDRKVLEIVSKVEGPQPSSPSTPPNKSPELPGDLEKLSQILRKYQEKMRDSGTPESAVNRVTVGIENWWKKGGYRNFLLSVNPQFTGGGQGQPSPGLNSSTNPVGRTRASRIGLGGQRYKNAWNKFVGNWNGAVRKRRKSGTLAKRLRKRYNAYSYLTKSIGRKLLASKGFQYAVTALKGFGAVVTVAAGAVALMAKGARMFSESVERMYKASGGFNGFANIANAQRTIAELNDRIRYSNRVTRLPELLNTATEQDMAIRFFQREFDQATAGIKVQFAKFSTTMWTWWAELLKGINDGNQSNNMQLKKLQELYKDDPTNQHIKGMIELLKSMNSGGNTSAVMLDNLVRSNLSTLHLGDEFFSFEHPGGGKATPQVPGPPQ
jgi:hypothetical protein